MQLPWKRTGTKDQLIVSWNGQSLAYVVASQDGASFKVLRMGVEQSAAESPKDFANRLIGQGLGARNVVAMLGLEQSMLLQIPAPAVPPEELRSAVRYQIRDMVDMHIDDLTLDVLRVGDGQERSAGQLFVVAAANTMVRNVQQLAYEMDWTCRVIDVQEMAQRNLQSAWAKFSGFGTRATALLMLVNDRQALLTITANDELYYSRRLDLPTEFLNMQWDGGLDAAPEVDAYTPVDEYVPDYGGATQAIGMEENTVGGNDRAQRFLVEVQRSLDLWDRTWTNLPMAAVGVYGGLRSEELGEWLTRGLGHAVLPFDPANLFEGVPTLGALESLQCLPLLGLLFRTGDGS